ncbi:MAG: rhodanese family protein [Phycisphaerales bacterium]
MTQAANGVSENGGISAVPPKLLQTWLESNEAVLVDVREDFEHAEERITGSVLHPLSKFDAAELRDEHAGKRIVFHCRSGKRSHDAASRFGGDSESAFHMAGGIDAWKAAGLPTLRPQGAPRIPVMRQVQITAGALVSTGVVLGVAVSPWFLAISAFVGCGLMFAGFTGWCGMAKLLAVMPWNKSNCAV